MDSFNLICVSLVLIISLIILSAQNLFYIFLGFELLTIFYSLIIAANGGIRIAVLYSVLNFTAGAGMLALIPHDLSTLSTNINFFHYHPLMGQLFNSLIFLHAGAFFMAPIVITAYSSVSATVLPFIVIFASKTSLAVISKLTFGPSELLLALSILTLVYAFYRMSVEDSIPNALLANGIGHVGLVGFMIHSGGEVLHYYLASSIVHQMGFYIFSAKLSAIGISKFSQLKRLRISSNASFILLFISLVSNFSIPPTIGFATKAIALHNMGFIFSVFISFLSYIFVFLVPLKFIRLAYCNKRAPSIGIHTTHLEKLSIICLSLYLLFPFSLEIYSFRKILTQAALFMLVWVVYSFAFSKLKCFFCCVASYFKAYVRSLSELSKHFGSYPVAAFHSVRRRVLLFCTGALPYYRNLFSVSLSFITFLFAGFVALLLVIGI
ncbi:putative membrane protein [Neorickettsia helminthoeca str. Oregon]|uniref:Putative membrane protein n=2 Tax=Neorickettsia helminthoeca TaxID=33994 RepID=X5H4H1_9RICK|nr:putative membrane protein [Neorickettsia helminthoeca str. Oregon]